MIEEPSAGSPGEDVWAGRPAETDADRWLPSQVIALAVVATAGLMVSLTFSVLIPVLPLVAKDIGSSTTSTEWLLTSTLLAAAVAVPIAGRLGDLYGKRLMLMACAGFLTVGSLICALSHSLIPLVIGRSVTGLSVAAVPLGISLITVILPSRRALFGVALVSAMLGAGGALGLPLAGTGRRARRLPPAVLDLDGRRRRVAAGQLAVPHRAGPAPGRAGSTSPARSCSRWPCSACCCR